MAIPVCVSNLRRNQQQSYGSCRLAECSPRIWEMMRPDARGETTERVAVGAHGYRVWRGRVWATGRHFVKHTCFLPRVDFILGWFFSFFPELRWRVFTTDRAERPMCLNAYWRFSHPSSATGCSWDGSRENAAVSQLKGYSCCSWTVVPALVSLSCIPLIFPQWHPYAVAITTSHSSDHCWLVAAARFVGNIHLEMSLQSFLYSWRIKEMS